MPLVIPPGFAQCSIELRNSGDPEPWYITHGVDLTEVGGAYDAAGKKILGAAATGLASYLRTTTAMTGVHMTIGADGGNYSIFVPPAAAINGASTAEKLPQNCAALIRKNTIRPGRTGKGRMFVPGLLADSGVNDVGVIENATVSAIQALLDTWLDTLAGTITPGPTPMVLLHNAGAPLGTVPTPVTSLQLMSVIATQRRRLRR